jgi:hypothetical protein
MPSCDDCGLIENILDLARHMNRWCPENNDLKGKRDDDEDDNIPSKKSRLEEQTIIDAQRLLTTSVHFGVYPQTDHILVCICLYTRPFHHPPWGKNESQSKTE